MSSSTECWLVHVGPTLPSSPTLLSSCTHVHRETAQCANALNSSLQQKSLITCTCYRHQTYCQHSLHWQTLLLVGSHATLSPSPPPVCYSLPSSVRTADSFTSFRPQSQTGSSPYAAPSIESKQRPSQSWLLHHIIYTTTALWQSECCYPSYAPLTIRLLSNRIHRTSSSWPSRTRRQAPHSMSHKLQSTVHRLIKYTTAAAGLQQSGLFYRQFR